jgi:hypothetical protein
MKMPSVGLPAATVPVILSGVVLLAGCSPIRAPQAAGAAAVEAGAIPVVTLKVTDAGLEAPGEIPSGVVAIVIEGADPDNMPELARLNDGVTMEQLNETLAQPDPMAALPLVTLLGGAGSSVDGQVVHDLQPGAYAAVYFAPDGPPQVIPVTSGAPSGAPAPTADVAVSLVDFSFTMPDKIAAGPQVWQIDNAGGQWHEMAIVQLNEGATVKDVLDWLATMGPEGPAGPPPFEEGAFWSPMGAGERAWVTWDLPAGEYTVICFLPDLVGDMSSHAEHGMVRMLVVE